MSVSRPFFSVRVSVLLLKSEKYGPQFGDAPLFVVFFFRKMPTDVDILSILPIFPKDVLFGYWIMVFTVKMKENKEFVSLFKKGRFVCGHSCVVYFRKNGSGSNKLGISTGKKTGNAVLRSRCRRIIRQAYRENESLFPKGYDIVIVSRPYTCQCKSTDISAFFRNKVIPQMKKPPVKNKR